MNASRNPRIGVYVCHCGINIAASVDVGAVADYARTLPGVVVARDYLFMCSEPGQDLIRQDIAAGLINRVVVASCTPRMHEATFRGACHEQGLNPYYYEQANIREHCSWIHPPGEAATEKARSLVRAAVRRVAFHESLTERTAEVLGQVLVIGGGIAGMTAALELAEAGFPVTIIEKSESLGGRAARWFQTYPTLNPIDALVRPLRERVHQHENITVLLKSCVDSVSGSIGNFEIMARNHAGSTVIRAGTILIAIGFRPFDPMLIPELGYGSDPRIMSTADIENMLRANAAALEGVNDIVFVSCVGSRDKRVGNPFCSRVCCMINMKQAHQLRERLPEARITVFYIDVRAFGRGYEEYYDQVRSERVLYRRGNVSEIHHKDGRLLVRAEDTLLGQAVAVEADLVVLGIGMAPAQDHQKLSRLFKLARSDDGFFLEKHPKLAPVETNVEGVYLAGTCQAPRDIPDTVAHAKAAAAAAMVPLLRGTISIEGAISQVTPDLCARCGLCVGVCPYGALTIDSRTGAIRENPSLCKSCGACANICPSNAIKVQHFKPEQILAQVDGLLFPN